MASPERTRAHKPTDVFRTVNTLAYQKHRNDPGAPPGFNAHLDQARNVVMDKHARQKPKEPRSLTVIQMQDEAYIHQQMIANAKAQAKSSSMGAGGRGAQGIGSISRAMRPAMVASRKVRFTGPGGTTMQSIRAGDDSAPASPSGSSTSAASGAAGLTGPAAKAARFGGVHVVVPVKTASLGLPSPSGHPGGSAVAQSPTTDGSTASRASSLSNGAAHGHTSSSGSQDSPTGASAAMTIARTSSGGAPLPRGSSAGLGPSTMSRSSSGGMGPPLPRSSSPGLGAPGSGNAAGVLAGKEGASLLDSWQQQGELPGLSQERSASIGSTTLADKSMERLRQQPKIPGPPPPPKEIPFAEGYKPLTITDSLFERWNNASYGYSATVPVPTSSSSRSSVGGARGVTGSGRSSTSGSAVKGASSSSSGKAGASNAAGSSSSGKHGAANAASGSKASGSSMAGGMQSGRASPAGSAGSRGGSRGASPLPARTIASALRKSADAAAATTKSSVLSDQPIRGSFPPPASGRKREGSATAATAASDSLPAVASVSLPPVRKVRM